MKLIYLIPIFFLFSCQKTDFSPKSILEISNDGPDDLKRLTQLRLALSKTVAIALKDVQFREYILNKSREGNTQHFNEILLYTHPNDIVKHQLNLIQFLDEFVPEDARTLFGDSLFSILFVEDPCVVIKIPDIFYEYNWDVRASAPLVYAVIPSLILNPPYYAFHHTGYHIPFDDNGWPEHFYITVKLSEDYSLYDTDSWINEKGIPFTEILPQIEYRNCWADLEPHVKKIGLPYELNSKMKYIHRYNAFELWRSHCSYAGPLLMDNPCGAEFLRDCGGPGESKVILHSLGVRKSILFELVNNQFGDSYFFYFIFLEISTGETSFACIPALRYKALNTRKAMLTEKFKKICVDEIGEITMPYMNIEFSDNPNINVIDINFEAINSFQGKLISYDLSIFTYEDIIRSLSISGIPHPKVIHPTVETHLEKSYIDYRDNTPIIPDNDDLRLKFVF